MELYLSGFTGSGLKIKTVSTAEGVLEQARGEWDVILARPGDDDPVQSEILERVSHTLAHVPIVRLGHASEGIVTSAAATNLDDYLPRIAVSSATLLRSINHMMERRRLEEKVEELESQIGQASRTDSLTGLWNTGYLNERLDEAFKICRRYGKPLTLSLCEIRHFDDLTELYGFQVADEVLKACGRLIASSIRETDFAAPMGRNVFCVVFPNTTVASAVVGVERLRDAIGHKLFSGKTSSNFTIEACYGVAERDEDHIEPHDLIETASTAVKKARDSEAGHVEIIFPKAGGVSSQAEAV